MKANTKKNTGRKIVDLHQETQALRFDVFSFLKNKLPEYTRDFEQLYLNPSPNSINLACLQQGRGQERAEIAGACIGGHLNDNVTYWNFFFVLPAYRQAGIGSMLFDEFESRVKQAGRTRIECEIHDAQVAEWFAKRGYVAICGRDDYQILLSSRKEFTMAKQLA